VYEISQARILECVAISFSMTVGFLICSLKPFFQFANLLTTTEVQPTQSVDAIPSKKDKDFERRQ